MNERILKIASFVLAVLLLAFMGVEYYKEEKQQKETEEARYEYDQRTLSYRVEQRELTKELEELEKEVVYYGDNTNIMVGFAVNDKNDIDFIRTKAELYQFAPIIVIDCEMELSKITEMVKAAAKEWEIMLYSSFLSENDISALITVKSHIESNGKSVADVVFSRIKHISDEDADELKNAGFNGYTIYNDSPMSGQNVNGLVYFDFSRITSNDATVNDRLSSCYSNKASMIFVFDMKSVQSGYVSDVNLASIMDTLSMYTKKDNCCFSTIAETVEGLSNINQIKSDIKASHFPRIESINKRLSELDEIIEEIYNECFSDISK